MPTQGTTQGSTHTRPHTAAQRRPAGRPRGALRASLADVIASGLAGCADQLAAHTGWPPEAVRRTLWEMSRAGEARRLATPRSGHRGSPPGVFAQHPDTTAAQPVDALAFARAAWR
jgi:hypothetical protein